MAGSGCPRCSPPALVARGGSHPRARSNESALRAGTDHLPAGLKSASASPEQETGVAMTETISETPLPTQPIPALPSGTTPPRARRRRGGWTALLASALLVGLAACESTSSQQE